MQRTLCILLMVVGLVFVGGVAAAQTWTATTDGSSVVFNNNTPDPDTNDEWFRVCDTAAYGNGVYVDWTFNGSSGSERWAGGNGTCHNFGHTWAEDKAVTFRSCEEIDFWPDDCSGWKSATS